MTLLENRFINSGLESIEMNLGDKAVKSLNVLDLGCCPYGKAWEIQKRTHADRFAGKLPDTLILVEHPHVYTLGKNANASHLIASQEYLKSRGIEIFKVDRGGDITYHGPGQLVSYPIFNLKEHKESIAWYVYSVEEVLIQMLAGFDIQAGRIKGLTGIWVGDKKIAAIGMRVSRWVTMHGFALNVSTDLSLYNGIVPCGIVDKGVARMIDLNPAVSMKAVKIAVVEEFVKQFGFYRIRE
ncbi:MAG: lipoyl(octanoyl) transferase [Candidatus Marinimicrobia bacterium CG08_land_8_20_14_0_20_45_22]|nr:MAG: lipoyl(octanoyl) transferase [Candidatus Marinimicrobia bacterium CG08_land_8_20_14_0_20_45_22]